jgi:glutathione reductase (NADPH)
MNQSYDLVALGTGTAAKNVAKACRRAGWRVAVVDCLPYGGTCALRGCDPKKALWSVADAFMTARALQPAGIQTSELQLDWAKMMAFKRTFTDPVPAKREMQFKELGIDTFHGTARFIGPNTVAVGEQRLEASHILVATGAKPAPLPIRGAEHAITSREFLELDRLPKTFITIGGGYVGCEFAHTATHAGAKVTILQRGQPLEFFDRDMVRHLADKSRRIGIEIHAQTNVEAVEKTANGVRVHASHNDESLRFEAEIAVHAAGRVPALDALDLEAAGVERDGQGLRLTPQLRSASNPAVYAAGDAAAQGPALTPVAAHDAEVVAANLLENAEREPNYWGVPSVAFTHPPIGRVGMLESEAAEAGLRFRVNQGEMTDWQVVRHVGGDTGAYKVLIEDESERILGAHLVGPGTIEMINILAFATRERLPASAVRRFMSAFPSAASNLSLLVT